MKIDSTAMMMRMRMDGSMCLSCLALHPMRVSHQTV